MFMGMDSAGMPAISCVFAPSLDTPAHIELAERLGYRRAWGYDSPGMYADPGVVLALAAGRTPAAGPGAASPGPPPPPPRVPAPPPPAPAPRPPPPAAPP